MDLLVRGVRDEASLLDFTFRLKESQIYTGMEGVWLACSLKSMDDLLVHWSR